MNQRDIIAARRMNKGKGGKRGEKLKMNRRFAGNARLFEATLCNPSLVCLKTCICQKLPLLTDLCVTDTIIAFIFQKGLVGKGSADAGLLEFQMIYIYI